MAGALCVSAATQANTAEYVVAGIKLGERVAFGSPDYRAYSCQPNPALTDLTQCQRSRQRAGQKGALTIVEAIVHTQDGTTAYLATNVTPAALNKVTIDQEVGNLANAFGERPQFTEPPYPLNDMTSVIASWGPVKLEPLDWESTQAIVNGTMPLGAIVDHVGDVRRSAQQNLPIYRVTGGQGYVYSASFDKSGLGHRRYIAVNATLLAVRKYEADMRVILQKEDSRASDDYRLWPDVAKATRQLARETSVDAANNAMNRVFASSRSKKFQSRVWAILPGGVIEHLAAGVYSTVDTYPPNSKYQEIRRNIDAFLAATPNAPFSEFLYYTIGEFEKGLKVAPKSPISDVLHYAAAHKKMETLLQTAFASLVSQKTQDQLRDSPIGVDFVLGTLNTQPELYESKPLGAKVPGFAAAAEAAKPHFKMAMQNGPSAHADDAAYMLGWIAQQEGNPKEALAYYGQATIIGNSDYSFAAVKQALRILRPSSIPDQLAAIEANPPLAKQPVFWYLPARAYYRGYDYQQTISTGERALRALGVAPESLPATTDSGKITAALDRINPDLRSRYNLLELIYIVQASREFLQFENFLGRVASERPPDVYRRVKSTVAKYALFLDEEEQHLRKLDTAAPEHRDLRQAIRLIDTTMAGIPKNSQYQRLREWLHYKRVVVLAAFDASRVSAAVADMEKDVPASQLIDDALAEQIRAEGIMLRDLNAAQRTLKKLVDTYPTGNAVDNGYTWMAIAFRCEGRLIDADRLNRYIVSRFPLTRHAQYARDRMADPKRQKIGDSRLEACKAPPS